MEERELAGGQVNAGVVRVGSTVRRPQRPGAEFAHRLLTSLEQAGFDGAPRYLGVDDKDREILSFVEGWVPPSLEYGAWSDGQLIAAARLVRRFHDATRACGLAGDAEVVLHGDVNPTNMVWCAGTPTVLIDFDHAHPGARIDDIAYMCWTFVLAGCDDEGVVGLHTRARRLRLICDAYGFTERDELLDAVARQQDATIELVRDQAMWPNSKRTATDVANAIGWVERETAWLRDRASDLSMFL